MLGTRATTKKGQSSESSSELGAEGESDMDSNVLQLRKELMELEIEKLKLEMEVARLARAQDVTSGASAARTEGDGVLRYSQIVRGVLSNMPEAEPLVPSWFSGVESMFNSLHVPESIRGAMILPFLTERMRSVANRIAADAMPSYDDLKGAMLEELQLAPAEYRELFYKTRKDEKESWGQFASRLGDFLGYYLKSSEVTSLEMLRQLLIADQLKRTMHRDTRAYVDLSEKGKWLPPAEVAKLAVNYERTQKESRAKQGPPFPNREGNEPSLKDKGVASGTEKRSCFGCGKLGHIWASCPKPKDKVPKGGTVAGVGRDRKEQLRRVVANERDIATNTPIGSRVQLVPLVSEHNKFQGRLDSGADITVIRRSVIQSGSLETSGPIVLRGAFGQSITADLMHVPLRADCDEAKAEFEAEAGDLGPDLPEGLGGEPVDFEENEIQAEVQLVASPADAGEGTSVTEFRRERLNDESLRDAWKEAENGTHGMVVREGLLYHKDDVDGRHCEQVVLPASRREKVLELAHDSPWGGHFSQKKTKKRIKGAFFWPTMAQDVRKHCQSCHACQVKSRANVLDRVPITPLSRPVLPFQTIFIDCIGPLDPPSARGHRYALCIVDLCTRWAEVVCLRSLTAQATCDALVGVFARFGAPQLICSDQGTNFVAKLTRLLTERLGVEMRFSTPDHLQSSGLVERCNGTFKAMLRHVIQDHRGQWDKYVPCLLWAYHEVPNETTGVSPFKMMFGRSPSGPLTLLSKHWTGEWAAPVGLNSSTQSYLLQLRKRMKEYAELAQDNTVVNQQAYAARYNLRARVKSFAVGDLALILEKDSSGKLKGKWIGPVKIEQRVREHSYVVKLPDGRERLVHANKLRRYYVRMIAVGVVFDADDAFGALEYVPARESGGANNEPQINRAARLTEKQHKDLTSLRAEFSGVFSDKPGQCKVGWHKIGIVAGTKPKRTYPYKIPMKLRAEVDRQTDQLLDWGLIYPVENAEAAFNATKGKLAEAPQLAAPDLMREFVLTTDASEFAVGACLSQENGEGREQPIAFLSKKLTPTETRWATIEREAFAIVWALSKLETWLFGAKIKVVTDHNPLKYLTLTSPSSARLTRWVGNVGSRREEPPGRNDTAGGAERPGEVTSDADQTPGKVGTIPGILGARGKEEGSFMLSIGGGKTPPPRGLA
ncbi:uncharacterized protein LOC120836874 [Ixodes scapularis]|uniref:uncharacterized protein LOC120836874 n=1 Tax=Ixodes scapularis TaxID=6945 RepID=UPI001A9F8A95|nr:uncharacterized protein LOC120836874 [Ixodes scapularis]